MTRGMKFDWSGWYTWKSPLKKTRTLNKCTSNSFPSLLATNKSLSVCQLYLFLSSFTGCSLSTLSPSLVVFEPKLLTFYFCTFPNQSLTLSPFHSYQPPHVRRKLRIQEMVQKYRYELNEPEFYTHLFTSPLCWDVEQNSSIVRV